MIDLKIFYRTSGVQFDQVVRHALYKEEQAQVVIWVKGSELCSLILISRPLMMTTLLELQLARNITQTGVIFTILRPK